ncbi:MAG TPA: hypothetical protein VHI13_10990 [Candidatus Kapabacteria bacterium]|nr:hypothetical protein [Candidatus Kapabacteria bacterium]
MTMSGTFIRFVLGIALAATFLAASSATAQQRRWLPLGAPEGGFVNAFHRAGSIVLAGTRSHGLFRSVDNGLQWHAVEGEIGSNIDVNDFAVTGDTIYAATGSGIYRSMDSGATWSRPATGSTAYIYQIEAYAGRVVACGVDSTFFIWPSGVVEGIDGLGVGEMWRVRLAIGRTAAYACTPYAFLRSTDGAYTWEEVRVGGAPQQAAAVMVDGDTVIAGLEDSEGMIRSTDAGENWARVPSAAIEAVRDFTMQNGVIFATTAGSALLRSTDHGYSWDSLVTTPDVNAIVAGPGYLLAANVYSANIVRTADGGHTWATANRGLTALAPTALLPFGNRLLVGTEAGIYALSTADDSWTRLEETSSLFGVKSLAQLQGKLVMGTPWAVYLSTDGGAHWSEASAGWLNNTYDALVTSGPFLYVISTAGNTYRAANRDGELTYWKTDTSTTPMYSMAAEGSTLIGTDNLIIWRSTDSGYTWTSPYDPNDPFYQRGGNLNGVASTHARFWALAVHGLYSSPDGALPWTEIADLHGKSMRAVVEAGGDLYAGTDMDGVFRSADNGETWKALNDGLDDPGIVNMAVVGDNLYASTRSGVLYRISEKALAVRQDAASSSDAALMDPAPNPVTGSASIGYSLPNDGAASITLLDPLGRTVRTLASGHTTAGMHTVRIDAAGLPGGIYYCCLHAGNRTCVRTVAIAGR